MSPRKKKETHIEYIEIALSNGHRARIFPWKNFKMVLLFMEHKGRIYDLCEMTLDRYLSMLEATREGGVTFEEWAELEGINLNQKEKR